MKSRVGALAQLVFVDLIGSIAWFPVWWYTKGLQKVIRASYEGLYFRVRSYAFAIWIKNFFVPMYGQYDWAGRLVSIFIRTFVILGRGIAITVEAFVYLLGIIIWTLIPIVSLLMAFQGGITSIGSM